MPTHSVTEYQSHLAASHNDIGLLLRATGQPDASRRKADESALAIQQEARRCQPLRRLSTRGVLAAIHTNLGNLPRRHPARPVRRRGRPYESALAIQQKLADANPFVTEYQSNLASSHDNPVSFTRQPATPT